MIEHLFVAAPGREAAPVGADDEDEGERLRRWVEAIARERDLREDGGWRLAAPPRTVHVGGESPSRLGPTLAGELLGAFGLARPSGEFSIEVRAGDLGPRLLAEWCDAGVTRVSVSWPWGGALRSAVRTLSEGGIRRWALDLPFGRGTPESDLERLGRALEAGPDQISLVELPEAHPIDDRAAEAYLRLAERLETAGYHPWELTSFAREGRRSEHFAAVWRGEAYLGLGPGANSFDGERRIWNLSGGGAYFSRIGRGLDPLEGREKPDARERHLERVWSGLRLAEGLALAELPDGALEVRARWVAHGWAHPDPRRLRLTRRGWLLLDGLAIELASMGPDDVGPESR